jgi:ABC-type nickel/cobalt efflux system permease component RcnA
MLSILSLGLFLGIQHALDADHLAAVASMASRKTPFRRIIAHGMAWGVGHTFTLVAVSFAVILFGGAIDGTLSAWFEMAVGVMLVFLGGQLLFRLFRERVHFHVHRHADGIVHFHAHSHKTEKENRRLLPHAHTHAKGLPFRALLVGMVHGMAGSAALLILSASTLSDPISGLAYIALFGLGSIIGMTALCAVIAVPLFYSSRTLNWTNWGFQALVGAGTLVLGGIIIQTNGFLIWG